MKKMKKIIALTVATLFITGCQQLEESYNKISNNFQKTSLFKPVSGLDNQEVIKTSLSNICNDFSKNKFKAEDKWNGKIIQFTDVIKDVSKSRPMVDGDPFYSGDTAVFIFTTGKISSTNHRECRAGAFVDISNLKKYSIGNKITIKGVINIGELSSNLISLQPAEIIN